MSRTYELPLDIFHKHQQRVEEARFNEDYATMQTKARIVTEEAKLSRLAWLRKQARTITVLGQEVPFKEAFAGLIVTGMAGILFTLLAALGGK